MTASFPFGREREGSISGLAYGETVRFARRIIAGWATTVAFALAAAAFWKSTPSLTDVALITVTSLLILSLVRKLCSGSLLDHISAWLLVPLAAGAAPHLLRPYHSGPLWGIPLAALISYLYVSFCGRNLSLFGLAALGSLAAAVLSALAEWLGAVPSGQGWQGWALATLTLIYVSYDTAMILRRRKKGELAPAVADYYRDLLNFISYPIRVLRHWSGYRFDPFPGGGGPWSRSRP